MTTYKRISNEEAARLCLAGSEKVRFCPGYPDGLPKLKLDQSATVSVFLSGSGYEFYIEQEPKQAVGCAAVLTDHKYGRALSGFVVADLLQDFTLGKNVKVTIEEIV